MTNHAPSISDHHTSKPTLLGTVGIAFGGAAVALIIVAILALSGCFGSMDSLSANPAGAADQAAQERAEKTAFTPPAETAAPATPAVAAAPAQSGGHTADPALVAASMVTLPSANGPTCARVVIGCPPNQQCERPAPGTSTAITDAFEVSVRQSVCRNGNITSVQTGVGQMSDGQRVTWTATPQ